MAALRDSNHMSSWRIYWAGQSVALGGNESRLARPFGPGRQTGSADRARYLHRVRHQRRDSTHGRVQKRQAHPRHQHRRRSPIMLKADYTVIGTSLKLSRQSRRDQEGVIGGPRRILRRLAVFPPPCAYFSSFAAALVFASAVSLSFLSEQTDRFFAWTINPPLTAAFLGAGYAAITLVLLIALLDREWTYIRLGVSGPGDRTGADLVGDVTSSGPVSLEQSDFHRAVVGVGMADSLRNSRARSCLRIVVAAAQEGPSEAPPI